MNPVEEFLKIALSQDRIGAAVDEAQRRADKLRHARRLVTKKGDTWPEKARAAEAKAVARVKKLEAAYERRLSGSGIKMKAYERSGKPFRPGGQPYVFAKTKAEQDAALKAHKRRRFRKKVEARTRMRSGSYAEGRGSLRKRKAVPRAAAGPAARPAAAASSAAKAPVSTAAKAAKGIRWGRVAKGVGAAAGLAGLGYGAYKALKGRKTEKTAMIAGLFDELDHIRGG